jgi:arylsulfatase
MRSARTIFTARAWLFCIVAVCGAALAGSSCRHRQRMPNILLIVVDTLRADHLGAYGYQRPTSPHFDALARRGVLFTRAHSVTSWTNPSMAALFTGEPPRVWQSGATSFIAPTQPTLAENLQRLGYRTAAIVANPVLPPGLGFGRGFDEYVGVAGWIDGFRVPPKQPAEQVNGAALRWIAAAPSNQTQPWFLYVHFMEPHWPYQPPDDTARRFWRRADVDLSAALGPLNQRLRQRVVASQDDVLQAVDLYDAAVAHVDEQIGVLLDRLEAQRQLEGTIICIVADHGEELGDHGGYLHAHTLYEEVLHVPLLIVPPDGTPAQRNDTALQTTGVARTLLDLAGARNTPFAGTSLLVRQQPVQVLRAELITADGVPTHRRALLDGTTKLVQTTDNRFLLFDLAADPGEQTDLAASQPTRLATLRAALQQAAAQAEPGTMPTTDPAVRERMRALGYDF